MKQSKNLSQINNILKNDNISKIENDEQLKYGNEPRRVVQERLDACLREIELSKKVSLEYEARAVILRQIIRQNDASNDSMWFSICPTCETVFGSKVKICTNCGFTENKRIR